MKSTGNMTDYNQRIEAARTYRSIFAEKFKVEICSFDQTALAVHCTDAEHALICRQLKCSGFYSLKSKKGFVTNFGYY
jgi:hypothetical protein